MAIRTQQGAVLIVGCSHAGIEKILEVASTIDSRIYSVTGGFHLVDRSRCRGKPYGVIVPGHVEDRAEWHLGTAPASLHFQN